MLKRTLNLVAVVTLKTLCCVKGVKNVKLNFALNFHSLVHARLLGLTMK